MVLINIYPLLALSSLAIRIFADEGTQQEGTGEQPAEPQTDDSQEPAAPSTAQTVITYGIGGVIGLAIGLWVLFYLCRKGSSDNDKADKPSSSSAKYTKLSTDDIERGGAGLELPPSRSMDLSSSRSSSRNSASSGDEGSDPKNWDDWDEENGAGESRGEFVQHSGHTGVPPPSPPRPPRELPSAVPSVKSNSSLGSLGSLGSAGSLGKLSAKSASPSVAKKRVSSKDSRQKPAVPVGDDLFASIGIAAAPTFKEAAPSPLANSISSSYSPGDAQKRVSDVMADDEDHGAAGWVDDDDDDLDL